MSRSTKQLISRLLLATLLFAQGAVAAYACPALTGTIHAPVTATQMAAMPAECGQMGQMGAMDLDTPNLCLAHCQIGQQINDHPGTPALPPFVASALVVWLPRLEALTSPGRTLASERVTAAGSPPHTILHCCFRI